MSSDTASMLSPGEARDLQRLAGIMIPASAEFAIPGADDALIFADIVRSLGRDRDDVRAALAELAARAGSPFADLAPAQAEKVAMEYLASDSAKITALSRAVLQCYYRDDRVLRSVGHEPRPPFPQGHTLEQGDWSLLDAVRNRPKLWRDDRAS